MDLEFNIYQIKKDSKSYKWLSEVSFNKYDNEFIIVGEVDDNYRVLQLRDSSLTLFSNVKLDNIALLIKKEDLEFKSDGIGVESAVLDIPRKHLTLDIIENILRLNYF
ncbi:MAG TPA: hypothetical protein VIK34_05845 [Clostridiaceae bacterium]